MKVAELVPEEREIELETLLDREGVGFLRIAADGMDDRMLVL